MTLNLEWDWRLQCEENDKIILFRIVQKPLLRLFPPEA